MVSNIDAAELAKIQIIIYKEDGQFFYGQTPYDDVLVGLFNKIGGGFSNHEAKKKIYQIMYEKDRPKSI
jgi:hypothetical protein